MIRITSGVYRGRSLKTPPHSKTRPTASRVRAALLNSLQDRIPEARVADLFAGSGGLGFEALSRGAAHVTFVDSDRQAQKAIQENIQTLKVESHARLLPMDVLKWAERAPSDGPFDLVFADPPYADVEKWKKLFFESLNWAIVLDPDGRFVVEWVEKLDGKVLSLPEETAFLVKIREKNYGDTVLTTYGRKLV